MGNIADLWNKTVIIEVNECKLNSNVNISRTDDDDVRQGLFKSYE